MAGGAGTGADGAEVAAGVAATTAEEQPLCRYCFEGAEEDILISPCNCAGGQRWVHLSCLRRWQRGILVSQPTHPDLNDDNDVRHRVCNVCKADFTCKPPTRMELMTSFTGEELAALLGKDCFIGASKAFSDDLRAEAVRVPEPFRSELPDSHWIDGAYLIVQVVNDSGTSVQLVFQSQSDLDAFASLLTGDMCWQHRGRVFKLLFEGPLEPVAGRPRNEQLEALRALESPVSLRLQAVEDGDCGEDGIVAVNLTRPLELECNSAVHARKRARYKAQLKKLALGDKPFLPKVQHFIGGPCSPESALFALVIPRAGEFTIYDKVHEGLRAAQKLAAEQEAPAEAAAAAAATPPLAQATAAGQSPQKRPRVGTASVTEDGGEAQTAAVSDASGVAAEHCGGGEPLSKADGPGGGYPCGQLPVELGAPRTAGEAVAEAAAAGCASPVAPAASPPDGSASFPAAPEGGVCARPTGGDRAVRVNIFWGVAGWSRCQLIGEIASGSWGLCRANPRDVAVLSPNEVYPAVLPRLVFAPRTEMSEAYGSQHNVVSEEVLQAQSVARLRVLRRRHQRREEESRLLIEQQEAGGHVAQDVGLPQAETDDGNGAAAAFLAGLGTSGSPTSAASPRAGSDQAPAEAANRGGSQGSATTESSSEDSEEEGAEEEDSEEEARERDAAISEADPDAEAGEGDGTPAVVGGDAGGRRGPTPGALAG